MADRRPFQEKYSDLPKRWKINDDLVNYIIRRYSKKLEEELQKLKVEGIKLPKFFRDKRTDEEYVYDLIDGWLIEDIICDAWLRSRLLKIDEKITIIHMGTNRDRTLQKFSPKNISTVPDFVYKTSCCKEIKIELQMARESRESKGYDMKESKVKRARKEGYLFLWVIIPEDSFFIINPLTDLNDIEPIINPSWGGKSVYRLGQEKLKKFSKYPMSGEIPKEYYQLLGLTKEKTTKK